jgi:ribonuclease H2 subunit C
MKGVVLRENEQLDENADRELKFSGHFDEFTYWNYDKVPSKNDSYQKMIQWQEISEAVSFL